jgi:hypothetical protein
MANSRAISAAGSKCYVFDVARARGHQTAGLNKSGSSIFGSQTANTTPPTPCCCFCILGGVAKNRTDSLEAKRRQGPGRRPPQPALSMFVLICAF